jgi:LmbE family N-acetylglucosaminyl deacetylase
MRIAALIAHPDYAALFLGGTFIKHARQGDEIFIVALSPGEVGAAFKNPDKSLGELAAIKTRELEATAKVQGVKEVRVLRFPDTKITNTPELRLTIIDLIREFKPDLVITHWPQGGIRTSAKPPRRSSMPVSLPICQLLKPLTRRTRSKNSTPLAKQHRRITLPPTFSSTSAT